MKFYFPENPEFVSCSNYNRWGYDEKQNAPIIVDVKTLRTIMEENNHTEIDLLKMDIEGSEYAVVNDILNSKIPIRQICIEVHHRFPGIGIGKTKNMVEQLNNCGYKIVAISESKEEYTFLKE